MYALSMFPQYFCILITLVKQPAMRPSAAQLLQHERIEFARKVSDTEKMYVVTEFHEH